MIGWWGLTYLVTLELPLEGKALRLRPMPNA
jgi:hypothetical protein